MCYLLPFVGRFPGQSTELTRQNTTTKRSQNSAHKKNTIGASTTKVLPKILSRSVLLHRWSLASFHHIIPTSNTHALIRRTHFRVLCASAACRLLYIGFEHTTKHLIVFVYLCKNVCVCVCIFCLCFFFFGIVPHVKSNIKFLPDYFRFGFIYICLPSDLCDARCVVFLVVCEKIFYYWVGIYYCRIADVNLTNAFVKMCGLFTGHDDIYAISLCVMLYIYQSLQQAVSITETPPTINGLRTPQSAGSPQ